MQRARPGEAAVETLAEARREGEVVTGEGSDHVGAEIGAVLVCAANGQNVAGGQVVLQGTHGLGH